MSIANSFVSLLVAQTLFLLIAVPSCSVAKGQTVGENANGMANQPFYIALSQSEIEAFGKRLDHIQIGDNWVSISGSLGTPTSSKRITPKKSESSQGTLRTYYVRKQSKDLVNEKLDQYAKLVFSTEDVLIGISSNVPGHERTEGEVFGVH